MDPDLVDLGERLRPAGLAIGIFDSTRTSLHVVGEADPDWRFEIGSVTKLFTARLLELLAEEGAVDIEEPVTALLGPQWKLGRHVTLGRLAEHKSGLPRLPRRAWRSMLRNPEDPYVDLTVRDLQRSLPPWIPRGRSFRYSNFGVALLGHALVARVGKPWPELVREYISSPLGLAHTDVDGPVAQPYSKRGKPVPRWTLTVIEAAGALRSTAADLTEFVRRGSPTLGWMHEDVIRWHNGGTGGSSSFVGWHDEAAWGVVLLANASVPNELTRHGLELLKGSREAAEGMTSAR